MSEQLIIYTGPSQRGWHRIGQFLECPQKYAWAHESGSGGGHRDGQESTPLVRGSLIHLGLAQHYARVRETQNGKTPELYYPSEEAMRIVAAAKGGAYEAEVQTCIDCVHAYMDYWHNEDFKVLRVEELYEGFFEGYRLTGRLDLVIEDRQGRVFVIDHKCLPAGARVWTEEGDVTIGSLVNKSTKVAAMTGEGTIAPADTLPVHSAGVQEVYAVGTKDGRTGRFGYRHPLWTQRGWVQAMDVVPGDMLAVPLALPDRPDFNVPDAFLRLLGQLISDAAMKESDLRWTKACEHKRARYMADVSALGDVPVPHASGTHAPTVTIRGKEVRGLLARYGVSRVNSPDRSIPEVLLASLSKRQIGLLLGGLWEGDGHAGVAKNGRTRICFSGRSGRLCADVHRLLITLGVPATLTQSSVKYKDERRPVWTVTVAGEGKGIFLDKVEAGVIAAPSINVPVLRASLNTFKGMKGLGRVSEDGNLWWVPVVEVRRDGAEECFDLEVPVHHTFVAEGVITHNSTGFLSSKQRVFYSISGQMHAYRWLASMQYGERLGGMRINMLQHSNGFKFQRFDLDPSPHMFTQFPRIIKEAEEQIARYKAEGRPPHMWPMAISELTCFHRYGACEHMDKCKWGAR